jgi:hypothetical protein
VVPANVELTWEPVGFATPDAIPPIPTGSSEYTFTITAPTSLAPFADTEGQLYATFGGDAASVSLTLKGSADTGVLGAIAVKSPVVVGPDGATATGEFIWLSRCQSRRMSRSSLWPSRRSP